MLGVGKMRRNQEEGTKKEAKKGFQEGGNCHLSKVVVGQIRQGLTIGH